MKSFSDAELAKIMIKLVEVAAKDGVITPEEKEMLDSIDNSLQMYKRALDLAREDGIITVEEQERLEKIREIIINTARIVAEGSDGIDRDEFTLLIATMVEIKVPKAK